MILCYVLLLNFVNAFPMHSKPIHWRYNANHEKDNHNSATATQINRKQNLIKLMVNKYMPTKSHKSKKIHKRTRFERPEGGQSDREQMSNFAQPHEHFKHENKILNSLRKKSYKSAQKADNTSQKQNSYRRDHLKQMKYAVQTWHHPEKRKHIHQSRIELEKINHANETSVSPEKSKNVIQTTVHSKQRKYALQTTVHSKQRKYAPQMNVNPEKRRRVFQTIVHPVKRRIVKDISRKGNESGEYLFTGTEVLILISIVVLLASVIVCCLGFIIHFTSIYEKKPLPTGDFKVDKWWSNPNSSRILFHLTRSKTASSDGASCKWSRSSTGRKCRSKIVCQCSSTNTSKSCVAF